MKRTLKRLGPWSFFALLMIGLIAPLFAADHMEREWESSGGKFKITGTFKEYRADKNEIVLIKKDGKEVTVPLAKLSDADREYVKKTIGVKPDKKDNTDKAESTLSESDEKLAQQLVEELRSQFRPTPSPKWEKVWSVPIGGLAQSVSFSHSPDYVAVAISTGACEVRNMADGSLVKKANEKYGRVNRVSISSDAKYLMSATRARGIYAWELESGKKIFTRPDPKFRFRNASLVLNNGQAIFADTDLNMHSRPLHGGAETIIPKDQYLRPEDRVGEKKEDVAEKEDDDDDEEMKKAETEKAETKAAPKKKFVAHGGKYAGIDFSPDSKKYALWQQGTTRFKYVNLEHLEQNKKRSAIWIDTAPPPDPETTFRPKIAGAIATNNSFTYLTTDGILHEYSGELPQDDQKPVELTFRTPMTFISVHSLHSHDGKYCAFAEQDRILVFPATNSGEWTMIGGPPAVHDSTWINPDMMRIISCDEEKNLVLWKAGNTDYLKYIGNRNLFQKLIAEEKFSIVDRAYVLMEKDPEAIKNSLLNPWTRKFMDRVESELSRQSSLTKTNHIYDAFRKWHNEHRQNNIAYIYYSHMLFNEAWKARGTGGIDTVSKENYAIFRNKLGQIRPLLTPVMKRKDAPAEAVKWWLRMCEGTGWNEQEVKIGVEHMVKNFPLDCQIHGTIAIALMPFWHGEPGDAEQYCKKIADMVDPKYGDAIYAVICKRLIKHEERFSSAERLFAPERPYAITYSDAQLDWRRISRGANDLVELFPEDSQAIALALFLNTVDSNLEQAKQCLKIIDEKHDGIVSSIVLSYKEIIKIRKALKKASEP